MASNPILEEFLINLVREKPALYNFSCKEYKDKNLKDNCWAEIAKELEITGE